MKPPTAACVAAAFIAATWMLAGAERAGADSTPTRLPAIAPRGSIDAAGLRRLAQASARGEAATEKRGPISANEYETPPLALGGTSTFVPGNDPPPLRTQAFAYSWTLKRSFRGNRFDGSSSPMDPSLAAGPSHLVAMTNLIIVFYSKAGDSLAGAPLNSFFRASAQVPNLTDPRVVYDPGSGRFFAICLALNATMPISAFELAVSNSSDPTSGWTFYEVFNQQDGLGIDYPYLGFGAGAVYLSGIYIRPPGWPAPTRNHVGGLWVADKAALLAATSFGGWQFTDVPGGGAAVSVAACARWSTPPAGLDNFVLGFENVGANWNVHTYGVTLPPGFPAIPPTLDRRLAYTVPASGPVPDAPQLGGPALLQTSNLGAPLCQLLFINGHIHTANHMPSGSGLLVRHYDADVSGWPSVSGTTEDFWDGSSYHYYPSVAVNPWGDVGLVYTRSSTAEFASALWTFRPQDEGAFLGSQMLRAGEVYYGNPPDNASTRYRWGDYSGAAIDPVTGGLWFLNMYAVVYPSPPPQGTQATWIGYVPHAVFVDASFFFTHTGSRTFPWNLFLDGYNAAWNENDLVLKAGSYHAGLGVLSKPLTIIADGGTAVIDP